MVVRNKAAPRDILEIDIPWENPAPVWEVPDSPYTIVTCDTQWDYEMEGYFLAHCIGTKNHAIFSLAHSVYSLRDEFGIPHCTILCVRENEYSPYGASWDIGSVHTFIPDPRDEPMRILQVRGREDNIAMIPFHRQVREWYVSNGGKIQIDPARWEKVISRFEDTDVDYHFRYLLDESVNHFQWAHWNERMRWMARLEGTSL